MAQVAAMKVVHESDVLFGFWFFAMDVFLGFLDK
jgi:hypothetical protein